MKGVCRFMNERKISTFCVEWGYNYLMYSYIHATDITEAYEVFKEELNILNPGIQPNVRSIYEVNAIRRVRA